MDEEKTLEETVKEQLQNTYNNGILIGAQTICSIILDRINQFESEPGKKSTNDYKRCLKKLTVFCNTGVSKNFENIKHKKEENNE